MKKVLILLSLVLFFGCTKDVFEPIDLEQSVPKELQIYDFAGLKVQSTIVFDEVKINAKLPTSGTYRIKIRDIGKNLVSQEKITANEGDNILSVYVSSLENDSYILELTDDNHKVLGMTTIVVNH